MTVFPLPSYVSWLFQEQRSLLMAHPEVTVPRTICMSWTNTWQRKPTNRGGEANSQTGAITVGTESWDVCVFVSVWVGPLPKSFISIRDLVWNTSSLSPKRHLAWNCQVKDIAVLWDSGILKPGAAFLRLFTEYSVFIQTMLGTRVAWPLRIGLYSRKDYVLPEICQQVNSLRAGLPSMLYPQHLAHSMCTVNVCRMNKIQHCFVRLKPFVCRYYKSHLHYFYGSCRRIMTARAEFCPSMGADKSVLITDIEDSIKSISFQFVHSGLLFCSMIFLIWAELSKEGSWETTHVWWDLYHCLVNLVVMSLFYGLERDARDCSGF